MTTLTIRRFILSCCLLCLCAAGTRAEWYQGSGYSGTITVPRTYPIDSPSGQADSGRRVRDDDGRPPRQEKPSGPGFFQRILNEWEKKENERVHREETRRVKEEIGRLSAGVSIQVPPSPITLTPGGTPFFDTGTTRSGHEIAAGPISGVRTPADRIPRENLRRAGAILAPIASAMNAGRPLSDEDVSFLASQAAFAMEGAPLSVELRDLPSGREDATRRFAQQSQELGQARIEAEEATAERVKLEERLLEVQNAITRRNGDGDALLKEREAVLAGYRRAHAKEAAMKEEAANKGGAVTIDLSVYLD